MPSIRTGSVRWLPLLVLFLHPIALAQDDPFVGTWSVDGWDTRSGSYSGTAQVSPNRDGLSISVSAAYEDGSAASWAGTAARTANGFEVRLDPESGGRGITGALEDTDEEAQPEVTIRGTFNKEEEDALWGELAASDGSFYADELWIRKDTQLDLRVDCTRDGRIDDGDERAEDALAARLTVNSDDDGSPYGRDNGNATLDGEADRHDLAPLQLLTRGLADSDPVTFTAEPAGRIRLFHSDGQELLAPANASATVCAAKLSDQLLIEGVQPGDVQLTVSAAGVEDRVLLTVTEERVYLFLWGYGGTEAHYTPREIQRLERVLNHLKARGYKVYDDGEEFAQSKLDAAFSDESLLEHPRVVILDRATTRADLFAYLDRGTVRGLFWASHGYMEPFPGCPDDELDVLESRVWSGQVADPTSTDRRNFVREFKDALATQSQALDFCIMHSCATGGLGEDYWDEPWQYVKGETKARALRYFEGGLPPAAELRFNTYDQLEPHVHYLVTYVGSAYFGLHDVNMTQTIRSITDTATEEGPSD